MPICRRLLTCYHPYLVLHAIPTSSTFLSLMYIHEYRDCMDCQNKIMCTCHCHITDNKSQFLLTCYNTKQDSTRSRALGVLFRY